MLWTMQDDLTTLMRRRRRTCCRLCPVSAREGPESLTARGGKCYRPVPYVLARFECSVTGRRPIEAAATSGFGSHGTSARLQSIRLHNPIPFSYTCALPFLSFFFPFYLFCFLEFVRHSFSVSSWLPFVLEFPPIHSSKESTVYHLSLIHISEPTRPY